ncbi:SubName: Full=Uncharacterized protein {ECO:0000313/EMBL:CCA74531.1} [Serendipita indica DSM 11827]|uniref:Uncharacterized protein n=1 Tax=Serendipita indica (strain DSM 11827) TaxID=1109443 RepID=G4TT88_SERID|nr:SubName: Full=Uncharacterized protein {ECO:0000313/EMBL:CCA74531.1} [Serendipita indica DSM 11827]CCA74531.1 hypothetical protein PIIN_08483 [Serendipita indica DSM 11827]
MPALTTVEFPTGIRRCRSPIEGDPPKVAKKPYDRPMLYDKTLPRRRYRTPLSARRITDEEQLKGNTSVPVRDKSQQFRPEVNWRRFANFDARLKENNTLPAPEGWDDRYNIPLLEDRVVLGREIDLPRRIRQDRYKSIKETAGFDARAVREQLAEHADACWDALDKSSWTRKEYTKARHAEVTVKGVPLDTTPMPTHLVQVWSQTESEGKHNIISPVHSAFLRASWSRLGGIPEYEPMDICTPVFTDGKEIKPEWEFARGELPFIRMKIDNVVTFGHLLAYTYFRNDKALIRALLGPLAEDLTNFVGQEIDFEQRRREWAMSLKMAANYTYPVLRAHAWFIRDLAENGNCVGMEGRNFWWVLDACLRVVLDAIVAQERFEPGPGEPQLDSSSEEESEDEEMDSSDDWDSSSSYGSDCSAESTESDYIFH